LTPVNPASAEPRTRLVCAACGAAATEPVDVCPTCWADRLEHRPAPIEAYPGAVKAAVLVGGTAGLWAAIAAAVWAVLR
jgi:hypothetical protein